MRGEICSRRGRAAMVAMEEDFIAAATAPNVPGGRGGAFVAAAPAAAAPISTPLSTERVHFEPVPVFVGAKDGWTGPVLAARTNAKGAPAETKPVPEASAYTGDKSPGAESPAELSAPVALQGAVRTPAAKASAPPRRHKVAAERARRAHPAPPKRTPDKSKAQ